MLSVFPIRQHSDGTVTGDSQVLVQANLSMSWHANLVLAGCIAVVCFGIAITLAFMGFWMVLPFAGLEVIFVTCCLYWTVRRLSRKEIITVKEEEIMLEWGYNQPDEQISLPRHWSRLVYKAPASIFDVGSLFLQSHGKRHLIGESLGREEKKELYELLQGLLAKNHGDERLAQ